MLQFVLAAVLAFAVTMPVCMLEIFLFWQAFGVRAWWAVAVLFGVKYFFILLPKVFRKIHDALDD